MPATSSPAPMAGPTSLAWWELEVSATQSQPLKILAPLGVFMYEIKYYIYADASDDIVYIYKTWSYYG